MTNTRDGIEPLAIDPTRELFNCIVNASPNEAGDFLEALKNDLEGDLRTCVRSQFSKEGKDFEEEILQITWVTVWRKACQCQGDTRREILAWMKAIALNAGISLLRDRDKLEELVDEYSLFHFEDGQPSLGLPVTGFQGAAGASAAPMAHRDVENAVILRDLLHGCREQLTPQEHNVFLLILYGYSKSKAAELLNVSRPRITQFIQQIQKKLTRLDIEKEILPHEKE